MKRKIAIFLLLSCIVIGIAGYSTYAYLIDKGTATNELGLARTTAVIDENFTPVTNTNPGTVIPKNPKVRNTCGEPIYVRMRADFSDSDAENQCEPLVIDGNWSKGSDGYYYYNKILNSGESTSSLFQNVKIKSDISKDDIIPFDIICYCESVQAYGHNSATDAWNSIK